jgi:hypothetical protein
VSVCDGWDDNSADIVGDEQLKGDCFADQRASSPDRAMQKQRQPPLLSGLISTTPPSPPLYSHSFPGSSLISKHKSEDE